LSEAKRPEFGEISDTLSGQSASGLLEQSGQAMELLAPRPEQAVALISELQGAARSIQHETALVRLFFERLLCLLPKRLIAVRFSGVSTRLVLAESALRAEFIEASEVGGRKRAGNQGSVGVSETPSGGSSALAFRDAVAGFCLPLALGEKTIGDVHVNYAATTFPDVLPRIELERADAKWLEPVADCFALVAERQGLARETKRLNEQFARILEHDDLLILATDLAGRVSFWSRGMQRLTGIAPGSVVGRELLKWTQTVGVAELELLLREVARTGRRATREVSFMGSLGASERAVFDVSSLKGPQGPTSVMAIGRDVTTLKTLKSQVLHSEKLATLGQIAAGVAHEINNPLTSIQVCAAAVSRKAEASIKATRP